MAVPREFLDELRARADLAAVVGRHVRLERRGREFVGLSPFQKEKTPSFTVVPDKGFYHCFSSGKHGDVFSFLMEVENLTFREAIERLAGEVGLELPRETPEEAARDSRRAGLKEANEAAARLFARQLESPAGAQTRHYLAERGVQPETIRTFRLGLAPSSGQWLAPALEAQGIPVDLALEAGLLVRPDDGRAPFDRFRHRLMFPITDLRGDVIAFGGRALGDAPAKYLNSPETPLFHKGATLYGLAAARQAARDQQAVIVVEGYMDVIAMHQAGFAHAVAPLGTALTEAQLALLWRLSDEPAICFDGDAAGQRAAARVAERALPQLVPGRSLGFVWLPAGEDPDSLLQRDGPAAMSRALAAVTPLADLVWRLEWGARPLETPEQRANLEQRLDARVAVIGDRRVAHWYRERFREYLRGAFPYGAHRAGRPQARSTGRFGERPATAGLRQPVAL
ncbi:MAG: DNA primase, partial [Alphaproteobacteria bacterium]